MSAVESRQAKDVPVGAVVTKVISAVVHKGVVLESTKTVGFGQQIVVDCEVCKVKDKLIIHASAGRTWIHVWKLSPGALVTTEVLR